MIIIIFLLSRNTESIIKSLWWAGYIAGTEGIRYACRSVMGNLVRKSPFGRPVKGWEENIRLTTGQNVGGGGMRSNYLVTYLMLGFDRIGVVTTVALFSLFVCLFVTRTGCNVLHPLTYYLLVC
jgi:hypothetical protein